MKFYIASSLSNAAAVKLLGRDLCSRGWVWTYDWTSGEDLCNGNHDYKSRKLRECAQAELQGVAQADVVIVMLPGGRGTYVEFGMALAQRKFTIVTAQSEADLNIGYKYPSAFLALANEFVLARGTSAVAAKIFEVANLAFNESREIGRP
ncbi:MAG: hypothetical protein ACRD2L_23155 [Terriglobia bacterium]